MYNFLLNVMASDLSPVAHHTALALWQHSDEVGSESFVLSYVKLQERIPPARGTKLMSLSTIADVTAELCAQGFLARERIESSGGYHDGKSTPYRWTLCEPQNSSWLADPSWSEFLAYVRAAVSAHTAKPVQLTVASRIALAAGSDGDLVRARSEMADVCKVDINTIDKVLKDPTARSYGIAAFNELPPPAGQRSRLYHVRMSLPQAKLPSVEAAAVASV